MAWPALFANVLGVVKVETYRHSSTRPHLSRTRSDCSLLSAHPDFLATNQNQPCPLGGLALTASSDHWGPPLGSDIGDLHFQTAGAAGGQLAVTVLLQALRRVLLALVLSTAAVAGTAGSASCLNLQQLPNEWPPRGH